MGPPCTINACLVITKVFQNQKSLKQVSKLLALWATLEKKSCLGPHIKYTNNNNKKSSHNVLRKFMILFWVAFIASLGCMRPIGRKLDMPGLKQGFSTAKVPYVYIYIYIYTHTYIYIHVYICIYVCVYIYMYVYI